MRIPSLFRIGNFILVVCFLFSCTTHYKVVKSQRAEYPVNANIGADSTVIKTYTPYKLKLDSQMNEVIGHTDIALSKKSETGESLLGNFFSDAALFEAKKIDPDIDFAMPSTNGGLRNDLPLGAITLSNVFELMPFENELIIFELKGTDVKALIDMIAASNGQPIAGISIKIVNRKPVMVTINGQPFNENKNYHVLTSDYISEGGDGVNSFKNPVARQVAGLKVRDALIKYIKENQAAGKKISSKLDGRITHD